MAIKKTRSLISVSMLMALSATSPAQDPAAPAPAPPQSEIQKWIATTDAQWKTTFKRDVTDGSLDEVTVVSQNEAVVTNKNSNEQLRITRQRE